MGFAIMMGRMRCYVARYAMGLYNFYNRMNGLFPLDTDSIANTEHATMGLYLE